MNWLFKLKQLCRRNFRKETLHGRKPHVQAKDAQRTSPSSMNSSASSWSRRHESTSEMATKRWRTHQLTTDPVRHITVKTGVMLNKILQCFGRETFLMKGRENIRFSFPFSSSNSAVVLQSSVERVFIFGGRQRWAQTIQTNIARSYYIFIIALLYRDKCFEEGNKHL